MVAHFCPHTVSSIIIGVWIPLRIAVVVGREVVVVVVVVERRGGFSQQRGEWDHGDTLIHRFGNVTRRSIGRRDRLCHRGVRRLTCGHLQHFAQGHRAVQHSIGNNFGRHCRVLCFRRIKYPRFSFCANLYFNQQNVQVESRRMAATSPWPFSVALSSGDLPWPSTLCLSAPARSSVTTTSV